MYFFLRRNIFSFKTREHFLDTGKDYWGMNGFEFLCEWVYVPFLGANTQLFCFGEWLNFYAWIETRNETGRRKQRKGKMGVEERKIETE